MATKALVVDNNPVVLRAISAILEREGCEVVTAPNGLEALNILKGYIPDIIFTDLVMPLIGGEQLCKIIRNNRGFEKVFLVVVSGIALDDFENVLAEKYYDFCVTKGNIKELRHHIRDALQRLAGQHDKAGRRSGVTHPRIADDLLPSTLTEELLIEKRHLNCILENLVEGIVELNVDGAVLSVNSAAQSILEVEEEDIIGSNFADYSWGENTKAISAWLSVQLADPSGGQLDIHDDFPVRIGEKIITASFIPVRDEGATFGLCVLRDITRQYRAEAHERELDNAIKLVTKMEAMSCMAGGIAHDFNNLLTVICGNLDILTHANSKIMSADRIKLIKHARSAAYMAVDLTRKISNSSPFGIVSRQKYILEEIVEDTVQRFKSESSTELSVECFGERLLVSVNPDQISAALTNILHNAIEAGSRDVVRVTTREVEFQDPVIISGQYVPAGVYACLAVQDSGQGIDRAHLLKIFDPYFSTKARGASKGMGLGLTVVYATMRNHGGYVVVDSTLGVGTTVSCYLPCYGQVGKDQNLKISEKEQKCTVMLIENDQQTQEVGRIMLEYLGHEVVIADSLQDGLTNLASRTLAGHNRVHVVMIDSSQELYGDHEKICGSLADADISLKVIITGGSMLDPVMSDCKRFGYTNALPKPFTLDSLKHVLMTVCS